MPALVNLLCFGFVVSGIEVKSLFSCAAVWLKDEKIAWRNGGGDKGKYMCVVLESGQKQLMYSKFKGEFIFVHYQRMCSILMDAC